LQTPLIQFREQHPEVRLDLVGDDLHLDLVRYDADIVIRPAIDEAPGITQVPLFMLVKKLFASQSYIDRYSEPKAVEELKHHKLIAVQSKDLVVPNADIFWVRRLGMPLGKLNNVSYPTNTMECAIEYAKQGLGIVASFMLMKVVSEAGLVNILPEVCAQPIDYVIAHSTESG